MHFISVMVKVKHTRNATLVRDGPLFADGPFAHMPNNEWAAHNIGEGSAWAKGVAPTPCIVCCPAKQASGACVASCLPATAKGMWTFVRRTVRGDVIVVRVGAVAKAAGRGFDSGDGVEAEEVGRFPQRHCVWCVVAPSRWPPSVGRPPSGWTPRPCHRSLPLRWLLPPMVWTSNPYPSWTNGVSRPSSPLRLPGVLNGDGVPRDPRVQSAPGTELSSYCGLRLLTFPGGCTSSSRSPRGGSSRLHPHPCACPSPL